MTNLKRFFVILFVCLFLFIGLFPCVAYAADDPPLISGVNNNVVTVPAEYRTFNTAKAIFDYYNKMYSYNMSNGQKLLIVGFGSSGQLCLIFNDIDGNALYAQRLYQNNARYLNLYAEPALFASGGWCPGLLYNYGNIMYDTSNFGTRTGYTVEMPNYVTKVVFVGETGFEAIGFTDAELAADAAVLPAAVNINTALDAYLSAFGGIVGETYTLDIGGIFSSMMTSSMAIFDGFADYTLFGIDIKGGLICLLVIAIVVFIIKFLRGG